MGNCRTPVAVIVLGALIFYACDLSTAREAKSQADRAVSITDAQLMKADSQSGNWLSYGRTYNEQRFVR